MKSIGLTVLAYLLAFVAWRQLFPAGILFYQGLWLALLLPGLQFLLTGRQAGAATRRLARFKDALLSFLLAYAFMFTVPTTVDRAYSVKLLLQLAEQPQGMSKTEIAAFYVNDFLNSGAIDKRLKEQGATGSIVEEQGRYHLTPMGRRLAASFVWMRRLFASAG